MSHYKAKTYAVALAEALSGKVDGKKIASNFVKLLEKNQDLKKAGEVLLLAEKLLLQKTGNKKVVVKTARKTDTKQLIKSFVKKGDVVEEQVNPALIAGVKLVVDGQ